MNKFKFERINCPICLKNNSIFIGYNGGNYHPNKKGLEWWRFKGDLDEALESPDNVACKKIPQN